MLGNMLFYGKKEEECGVVEFILTLSDEIWLKSQNETDKCDRSWRKSGAQNHLQHTGIPGGQKARGNIKAAWCQLEIGFIVG